MAPVMGAANGSSGILRVARLSGGKNDRSCYTPSVPARRERVASLRIEDHIDLDGVEEIASSHLHFRRQTFVKLPKRSFDGSTRSISLGRIFRGKRICNDGRRVVPHRQMHKSIAGKRSPNPGRVVPNVRTRINRTPAESAARLNRPRSTKSRCFDPR
jgi:hypothetical protein